MTLLPIPTNTVMKAIPNPCTGRFQTPSYVVDNMEAVPYMYGLEDQLYLLSLTLRDQANDYSLRCMRLGPSLGDWEVNTCGLEDAGRSADMLIGGDILTQTRLRVQPLEPGGDGSSTLHIYQYWYCRMNDTSYPYVLGSLYLHGRRNSPVPRTF